MGFNQSNLHEPQHTNFQAKVEFGQRHYAQRHYAQGNYAQTEITPKEIKLFKANSSDFFRLLFEEA